MAALWGGEGWDGCVCAESTILGFPIMDGPGLFAAGTKSGLELSCALWCPGGAPTLGTPAGTAGSPQGWEVLP